MNGSSYDERMLSDGEVRPQDTLNEGDDPDSNAMTVTNHITINVINKK